MHYLSLYLQLCTINLMLSYLMLTKKQMQICTGLNSLSPYNNEPKSRSNLCYGKFSFKSLVPGDRLNYNLGSALADLAITQAGLVERLSDGENPSGDEGFASR